MNQTRQPYTADFLTRLNQLAQLEDGWLDGYGTAPSLEILELAGRIRTALPHEIGRVYAYPTEEGGVLLEWLDEDASHSIEIHVDRRLSPCTVERD